MKLTNRKYVTLAISRKAHYALKKKAVKERRSMIAMLDIILGV